MASITSVPVPDPAEWCFRPDNNSLFSNDGKERTLAPDLWVQQGVRGIRSQLAKYRGDVSRDEEIPEKKESMESSKKIKKNKAHEEPRQQYAGSARETAGEAADGE